MAQTAFAFDGTPAAPTLTGTSTRSPLARGRLSAVRPAGLPAPLAPGRAPGTPASRSAGTSPVTPWCRPPNICCPAIRCARVGRPAMPASVSAP